MTLTNGSEDNEPINLLIVMKPKWNS